MYMETRAHMNYWSTDNFCGRWSLRTGTLFIASVTASWSALCVVWGCLALLDHCYRRERRCWYMPGPEADTVASMAPTSGDDVMRVGVYFVIVYHALYYICSAMVFIGVYKKVAALLSGWVLLTNIHMVLVISNLLLTLAFTTIMHLLLTLTQFVAALCAWVVVKSHRHALRLQRNRPPVPPHALFDYTVDGVDKVALDPVP